MAGSYIVENAKIRYGINPKLCVILAFFIGINS